MFGLGDMPASCPSRFRMVALKRWIHWRSGHPRTYIHRYVVSYGIMGREVVVSPVNMHGKDGIAHDGLLCDWRKTMPRQRCTSSIKRWDPVLSPALRDLFLYLLHRRQTLPLWSIVRIHVPLVIILRWRLSWRYQSRPNTKIWFEH